MSNAAPNRWNRFVSNVQTTYQKKQEEIQLARAAKKEGKIYNAKTKEWQFYFLEEELRELERQESSVSDSDPTDNNGIKQEEKVVADRTYYDLLKVSTNADSTTIKKAYYKQARSCHPDKNPDDPQAHEKFQNIGQAYQILSDPQKRALYDKDGIPTNANDEHASNIDPFVFFNVMFGSTLVEPYIGELWLASQTESMMNDKDGTGGSNIMEGINDDMSEEEKNEIIRQRINEMNEKNQVKQAKRQIKVARHINNRVKPYFERTGANSVRKPGEPQIVDADADAFVKGCREEADKIVAGAYGALYCTTIGFALQVAAEEYLGFETTFLGLGGHVARTKKNASGFAANMKLLGSGIKAASAGSKAMREAEELQQKVERSAATAGEGAKVEIGELEAQRMAETIDGSLPAMLEFAWAVNKRDIQSTLKMACKKLFDDASIPKELRMERARGVQILGREFLTIGKEASLRSSQVTKHLEADEIKARVAVATMTTMAKAQGQELTEEDQEEMLQKTKMEMKMDGRIPTEYQESMGADDDFVSEELDTSEEML